MVNEREKLKKELDDCITRVRIVENDLNATPTEELRKVFDSLSREADGLRKRAALWVAKNPDALAHFIMVTVNTAVGTNRWRGLVAFSQILYRSRGVDELEALTKEAAAWDASKDGGVPAPGQGDWKDAPEAVSRSAVSARAGLCGECGGTGRDFDASHAASRRCDACDGTGVIPFRDYCGDCGAEIIGSHGCQE